MAFPFGPLSQATAPTMLNLSVQSTTAITDANGMWDEDHCCISRCNRSGTLGLFLSSGRIVGNSEVMFSLTVRAAVDRGVTSVWAVTR
jgi:hypothetical protein